MGKKKLSSLNENKLPQIQIKNLERIKDITKVYKLNIGNIEDIKEKYRGISKLGIKKKQKENLILGEKNPKGLGNSPEI